MRALSEEAIKLARAIALAHVRSEKGLVTAGRELYEAIAAALQKLMDERDDALGSVESLRTLWHRDRDRAEAAEKEVERLGKLDCGYPQYKLMNELDDMRQRAEAAEADAALAWRRVTELQERCTALVLERRAAEVKAQQYHALCDRLYMSGGVYPGLEEPDEAGS